MIGLFLTCIHVVVCLVLILVILLQAGRGQGLAGPNFGSGNVQSLLGTRAADFLTKATSVSAICFLFTCIGLNFIESQRSRSLFSTRVNQGQPVDLDAIQKALKKVKEEKAVPSPAATTVNTAVDQGAVTAPEVPAAAASAASAPSAAIPAATEAAEKK